MNAEKRKVKAKNGNQVLRYFICGFSGAGKTTLLRKMKASGKHPDHLFIDLDEWILSQNSDYDSLGAIIEGKGWEWFRNNEKEELGNLLKSPNIWIALGGGTLNEELAQHLSEREDVKGYWLDTDFDTCWKRIQNDQNRPLVRKGREALKHLYEERVELYQTFERLFLG